MGTKAMGLISLTPVPCILGIVPQGFGFYPIVWGDNASPAIESDIDF